MLFDWFTVFAQIANFLILMWLLKRFLYKPILNTIDAREKRIADLLQETQFGQQQTELQQADLTRKNNEFAEQRETLLLQANAEAVSVKQEMLDKAAKEVAQQRSQWLLGLQKEQHNLDQDISQRTQQAVFRVARRALQDLSSVELESQITHVFIKQLLQLKNQQVQAFVPSVAGELVIRSAFTLSKHNKEALQQAIEQVFSAELAVSYELETNLVSGIEMVGSGHKLSWNIDDYLSNFEQSISGVVENKAEQDNKLPSLDKGELNASS